LIAHHLYLALGPRPDAPSPVKDSVAQANAKGLQKVIDGRHIGASRDLGESRRKKRKEGICECQGMAE